MVTLVVLNYNDAITTMEYVREVENYNCFNHIVVVDNCSTDDSLKLLKQLNNKKIDIIKTEMNGGYGYGNNYGINYAVSKYNVDIVLVTNPDVRYEENVVKKLENVLRDNNEIAIAAPKMTSPNGEIDMHTAWEIPTGWQYTIKNSSIFNRFCKDFFYKKHEFNNGQMEVGAVAGSMLMIKVSDFYKVKCYDENIFLFCEENVLGIKIRQLKKKIVLIDDSFIHYHSVSIKKSIKSFSKRERIMWKSRRYVLKQYYGFSTIQMLGVKVFQYLTITLRSIAHVFS